MSANEKIANNDNNNIDVSSKEKQDCIAILGFLMTKQAFSFVVKI